MGWDFIRHMDFPFVQVLHKDQETQTHEFVNLSKSLLNEIGRILIRDEALDVN